MKRCNLEEILRVINNFLWYEEDEKKLISIKAESLVVTEYSKTFSKDDKDEYVRYDVLDKDKAILVTCVVKNGETIRLLSDYRLIEKNFREFPNI